MNQEIVVERVGVCAAESGEQSHGRAQVDTAQIQIR